MGVIKNNTVENDDWIKQVGKDRRRTEMVAWNSTKTTWKAFISESPKEVIITNCPKTQAPKGSVQTPLQQAPTPNSIAVLQSQGYKVTVIREVPS